MHIAWMVGIRDSIEALEAEHGKIAGDIQPDVNVKLNT